MNPSVELRVVDGDASRPCPAGDLTDFAGEGHDSVSELLHRSLKQTHAFVVSDFAEAGCELVRVVRHVVGLSNRCDVHAAVGVFPLGARDLDSRRVVVVLDRLQRHDVTVAESSRG